MKIKINPTREMTGNHAGHRVVGANGRRNPGGWLYVVPDRVPGVVRTCGVKRKNGTMHAPSPLSTPDPCRGGTRFRSETLIIVSRGTTAMAASRVRTVQPFKSPRVLNKNAI